MPKSTKVRFATGLRPDQLWGYALRTPLSAMGAAPGPAVGLCAPHTPYPQWGPGLLLKKGEENK